jgi:hypothetical protein
MENRIRIWIFKKIKETKNLILSIVFTNGKIVLKHINTVLSLPRDFI